MNSTLLRLATASLFLSLVPDAAAQNVIHPRTRRGIMSGAPLALVLRGGSTDHILLSRPGNQNSPPTPFNHLLFPNAPDFRVSEMFSSHPDIELDAISTGNDFIGPMRVISGQNRAAPDLTNPTPRWQALHVTVGDGAMGLPGSLLHQAPLANQGPEGAVFGHYLEGSAGIPSYMLDATMLEQSSGHLGFPSGSSDVIAGMDWALAVRAYYSSYSPPTSVVFLSTDNIFYFSVTKTWALSNPNFALEKVGQNTVTTSGAEIYQVTWNGGGWDPPRRYLKASELGLDPVADDVDALALDAVHDTAVFSTIVTSAQTSQLRAYQKGDSVLPPIAGLSFASSDGELMTAKLGLFDDSDDVTGICDLDPEPGQADPNLGIDPHSYGVVKEEMGLSLQRTLDNTGTSYLEIQATGTGDYTTGDSDNNQPPLIVQFNIVPPYPAQSVSRYAWYDHDTGSAEFTEDIDPSWPTWGEIEVTALLWDVSGSPTFVGNSYRLSIKNN